MKKIIILLMLLPNIVLADSIGTIYTEYEPYLVNSNDYLEESDTIKRDEFKLYNTYQLNIEEKYAKVGELNDYQIEYNDFYLKKEYSLDKTEYTKDYQLKCLNNNNKLTSIKLTNFSDNIKINEIELIFNEEKVLYGTSFKRYVGSSNYLFDNKIDNNSVTFLKDNGILLIGFVNATTMDNVTVKFHFPKQSITSIFFDLIIANNYELPITLKLEEETDTSITLNFDELYNDFLINNNFSIENNCIPVYENEVPFYKNIKKTIVAQNNYLPFNDDELFLMDDFKILYNYQKREKLEILDNWYLKDTLFDINNFIVSSTIPIEDLTIIDNIDYLKSGVYLISLYYKNNLILEKNIVYENSLEKNSTNNEIYNTINDVSKKNKENKHNNQTKKQVSKSDSKTTTKAQITKNKSTYKVNQLKLNNQQKINSDKQTKFYILIVSILIISLALFEMCLLYVKRKYF